MKYCNLNACVCGEIGLVQSLGIAGIPIFVVSEFDDNVARYSRFVRHSISVPSYGVEQFIVKLLQLGKKFAQKPILLTDNDQAVLAISRHRELLQGVYRFLIPDREIIESILDKKKFYDVAQDYDLPVPATCTIHSLDELEHKISKLRFPCIIKPASTIDWQRKDFYSVAGPYKKAFRCTGWEELYSIYKRVSKIHSTVILQESIEGDDHRHYSINLYFDRNRILKGYYIYQKVRMYPIGAGRGSFFVTVYDLEILEEALKAADKFEMCGLVNIQFKRDRRTGELKLIEMEARLSVSSFLGPAAGVNLAAQYCYDLVREAPADEFNFYQPSVKYSDLLRDMKAFAEYRKQDKLSFREWLRSYRGKCVFNGFMLKDPIPVVKKMWFTILRQFNGDRHTSKNNRNISSFPEKAETFEIS